MQNPYTFSTENGADAGIQPGDLQTSLRMACVSTEQSDNVIDYVTTVTYPQKNYNLKFNVI